MLLTGKGAAQGIAVGSIFVYKKNNYFPVENFVPAGEEQSQLECYQKIKSLAKIELEEIKLSLEKDNPGKAAIFTVHQEIIDDIVINEEIPAKILNERWAGDWAIYHVYETVIVVLKQASDPLIAERAADFDDVRNLLLRLWYGKKDAGLSVLPEPVIIAADDLLPSDTASMDRNKVLAILTATGGITSHTAIIARSFGIPAIMGIQGLLDIVKHGQLAAVNAGEGTVILDPDETVTGEYIKKNEDFRRNKLYTDTFLDKEACTTDGVKIDIGLNISGAAEAELEAAAAVDFAGLFRTEFIYLERTTLPCEDEQFNIYRKVLETFGEKPVILRTLDIGGDKKISSMEIPDEENPFLGNRALRFCFSYPEIFKTQIRACLRASVYGSLWVMLPMAGSLDDIRRAKEQIAAAGEELKKEGKTCGEVKVGIMIEVPSIALIADLAAKEVDFASIGSNDLCQYLCAADRTNSAVEGYYQSYHPAMFRLIKETVTTFNNAGKPISLCGELGADTFAIPLLIGLGLRKFSMGAASVAAAKQAIASLSIEKCEEIAEKVLQCATAAEIKNLLEKS